MESDADNRATTHSSFGVFSEKLVKGQDSNKIWTLLYHFP